MSLQHLPIPNNSRTPKSFLLKRPKNQSGRPAYTRHNATSSRPKPTQARREHTSSYYTFPASQSYERVLDAQPDPTNPQYYHIAGEDVPATHNSAPLNEMRANVPDQTQGTGRTGKESGSSANTAESFRQRTFPINPAAMIVVALEGKFGVHVHLYANLRALGSFLLSIFAAVSVFSVVDVGDVEKWKRAFEVFIQLLT